MTQQGVVTHRTMNNNSVFTSCVCKINFYQAKQWTSMCREYHRLLHFN